MTRLILSDGPTPLLKEPAAGATCAPPTSAAWLSSTQAKISLMKSVTQSLFMICVASVATSARATTFYVANNGSDSNPGTSQNSPWKTIRKANQTLSSLRPGDSLLFRSGDVFRDDYLHCSNVTKAQAESENTQPCFGKQNAPITISSYGPGAKPILDGADPLLVTWTRLAGATFQATLSGPMPAKLYVDSPITMSNQLLPVPNSAGEYSSTQTYNSYDAVSSNNSLYVRGPRPNSIVAPLNDSSAWVKLTNDNPGNRSQTFPVQNSGLQNVESTPGSWYATGNRIFIHLLDGSDPNRHTFEGTYRPYGVLLEGARYFVVRGLTIEHVSQSGVLSVPFLTHNQGPQPGEHIQIEDNTIFNYGSITNDGLPLQEHRNPLQGGVVIRAGGEYSPHLITGALILHNRVGTMDCYFGLRGQNFQAGIIASGIDAGGPANDTVVQENFVSTVNAEGIIYSTIGLFSDPKGDRLLNNGGRVTGNELTNNQGNLFFTATAGGIDDHNTIHHSFGEGVQTGGHSTSTANAPQIHSFDLLYHIGKSASGVLFNGFDCNGGFANGYWLNNTVYDTNSAAVTFEIGCDSAHVHNNIFEQDVLRFPERDVINPSYLLYYSTGSAHKNTDFSHNVWVPGPNRTPFHGSADSFSCTTFFAAWPDIDSECRSGPMFRNPETGDFSLLSAVKQALKGQSLGAKGGS